jgi:hypothetical protein
MKKIISILISMLLFVTATTVTGTITFDSENDHESNITWIGMKISSFGMPLDWLHYDDGTCENALGLTSGGELTEAIKFTPSELSGYDGYEISRVRVMHGWPEGTPQPSHDGYVRIWEEGTSSQPGNLVLEESFTAPEGCDWVNISLPDPHVINASEDVWVGVAWDHGASEFPAGFDTDSSHANGGYLYYEGGSWTTLSAVGYPGNWCLWAGLEFASDPPETPSIPDGPDNGMTEVEYTFSTTTTDPNGDQIFYKFDWGDGKESKWVGPYNSGDTGSASHVWKEGGDFEVRVKAKDIYDKESNWSASHTISIVAGANLEVGMTKGGLFKVSTPIKNTGALAANGVEWKISFEGSVFIGKETTGTDDIPAEGEITINSGLILGLGSTVVTVTAEIPGGVSDSRTQSGFVFLFLINIKISG